MDVGYTLTLPDAPEMPTRLFTPLSIAMMLAPLVTQLSVAEPPEGMLEVERYRAAIGRESVGVGALVPDTTKVVLALLEPNEFWAVNWKVMVPVLDGYMVRLPDGWTGPYPWRLTDETLATFQLSRVELPRVTLEGLAENESMVGRDEDGVVEVPATTTVVDADIELEILVASRIYVVV